MQRFRHVDALTMRRPVHHRHTLASDAKTLADNLMHGLQIGSVKNPLLFKVIATRLLQALPLALVLRHQVRIIKYFNDLWFQLGDRRHTRQACHEKLTRNGTERLVDRGRHSARLVVLETGHEHVNGFWYFLRGLHRFLTAVCFFRVVRC